MAEMNDFRAQLLEQVTFLVKDDKNLPILEKLLEVHNAEIDSQFIFDIMPENNAYNTKIRTFMHDLCEHKWREESKSNDPNMQINVLKTENETLKKQIAAYEETIAEVKLCYEDLVVADKVKYAVIDELRAENEKLKEDNSTPIEHNGDLTVAVLLAKNKILLEENKKMKEEDIKRNNEILTAICDTLNISKTANEKGTISDTNTRTITRPLIELLDRYDLSDEDANKLLMPIWCNYHVDTFSKIVTDLDFMLSKDVVNSMAKSFKYIISNNLKLNEENTTLLLQHYLKNNSLVTAETMKTYLTRVGFTKTEEVIKNFYLQQATEMTKSFV